MKILLSMLIGLLLCFCTLVSCTSVSRNPISIDDTTVLYGYTKQTLIRGKEYRLTYGELQIEGTLIAYKPKGGISFRGNAKYKLDFTLGANKLWGVISVEATGIRIDLQHSDFLISGFMDDRTSKIRCDVVMSPEKVQGIYIATVDTRQRELRIADYLFQLNHGDFPIVGHIGFKNNLYSYKLTINRKELTGMKTYGKLKNRYELHGEGLTDRELSWLLILDILTIIHPDIGFSDTGTDVRRQIL